MGALEEKGAESVKIKIKPLLKNADRQRIVDEMAAKSTFTPECCRNAVLWIEHCWAASPGIEIIETQAHAAVRLAEDEKTTPDAIAERWYETLRQTRKADAIDDGDAAADAQGAASIQ